MRCFLLCFLPLLLLGIGCNRSEPGGITASEEAASKPANPPPASANATEGPDAVVVQKRMVINTGSLELQTAQLDSAVAFAKRRVEEMGGYVGKEQLNNALYDRQSHLVLLRVPQAHFTQLVKELEGISEYVKDKQINALDVTEEFVDNDARIRALRATEEQYYEVLRQARTVEDILRVRDYLGKIRTDIERFEGRQRYLSDQVTVSTLTVTFYKLRQIPKAPGQSFWDKLVRSLDGGWQGVLAFLLFVFGIWPIWVLVLGGYLAMRYIRKRRS